MIEQVTAKVGNDNQFWADKKVLVTGAGGFIGSHLVEELVKSGAKVTAFIRYNAAGSRGLLDQLSHIDQKKIRYIFGDLNDSHALDNCTGEYDTVFHLAAIIAIPFSYQQPGMVMDNNVRSTLHVLEFCRKNKIRRLVHTSSSEVYGTAQQELITENHPLEAQSPYAASKIASDKLVQSYVLSFDVPAVTLRPFNTFGPRQSARAIIPTIISQALVQERIFLGAMHPTRDFNYVADTVSAFLKIAETPGIEGKTFHVGSGKEISIGELADRIVQISERNIPIVFDATRIRPKSSEVNRLICDSTNAQQELGWKQLHSLDEGLKLTMDWISKNLSVYRPEQYTI